MTNLRDIRRSGAYALDDLGGPFLALSGSTTTSVTLGDLVSLQPNVSVGRFNGRWIYHVPQTGSAPTPQQRIVRPGSYVASTGTISIDGPWLPPGLYDLIEFSSLFPFDTPPFTSDTSYKTLINIGLKKLLIGDRVTLSISTSQVYTLPYYVTDESRLKAIWEPAPFGTAPIDAGWRGPRFVRDGAANLLVFDVPFGTATGSLSLDVLRPADTLIGVNAAALSDSTVGLVNEADEISPQITLDEIREMFLAEAYRVLDNRHDNARWAGKFPIQQAIAEAQPHYIKSAQPAPAPAAPNQAAA